MSLEVTIGRLDEFDGAAVDDLLEHLGIADVEAGRTTWRNCAEEIAVISVLNVSSMNHFNHYAAQLEGFTGAEAMNRTKFINLPWWLNSVWLPISFDPPREPFSQVDPMFVGSCQRLLAELVEIQRLSDFELGNAPAEYHVMRSDHLAWFKSLLTSEAEQAPYSEADKVRWVWRALHDGAELAIQHHAPVRLLG